ncbi:MAG: hypothetical protein VR65_26710 [Desulfobulbaceae bacterium BRH_c16a]|nr:MAG: hypothetical protein VR65_26710 [Desulfobulbaceae bacterium BRH_c16a]
MLPLYHLFVRITGLVIACFLRSKRQRIRGGEMLPDGMKLCDMQIPILKSHFNLAPFILQRMLYDG